MQPRDNWGIYSFLSLQCLAEGLKCNSFEACISKDGYSNAVGGKKGDGTFFFFHSVGQRTFSLSACSPSREWTNSRCFLIQTSDCC